MYSFLCGNGPMSFPSLTVIRQFIISIDVQTALNASANFYITMHCCLMGGGLTHVIFVGVAQHIVLTFPLLGLVLHLTIPLIIPGLQMDLVA